MKSTFKCFEILLLMCGVFGACKGELKSVMEGDSVTLNPLNLSQIKEVIKILWSFGDPGLANLKRIAQSDENGISFPAESFKGRLQLNQTGSLTIKNTRLNHSGLYKLQIIHTTGTSPQEFTVTVYESPSVIDAAEAEMKIMSVIEGESVTLPVPQLYGDELIVWRSGYEGKLIAKYDIEAKSPSLYNSDERFRDRLQLNDQTGSLTITNSRTTDSGLYTGKISSNKQTSYKRFTVTVNVPEPLVSPGAAAGIAVVVLLVAAAAAVVIYYFCFRTTKLPSETWSVPPRDIVTLNPDTEIQTGDEIQWLFGAEDTLIAEIKKETRKMIIYDAVLRGDETTGSLTIMFIRPRHAGHYTLKIKRGRKTLKKRFQVFVFERKIEVMEGDDVTLYPEILMQTNDEIQWLFEVKGQQTVIAEINTKERETEYDGPDWRFRDRLDLNKETGSLTIRKCTAAHTGFYTLKIRRSRETIFNRFRFFLSERKIEVMKGESVTLEPATEINKDDLILWLFEDEKLTAGIAMFKRETGKISTYDHVAGGIFKDRLELDKTTGSLTIRNTRTAHSGLYKLQIISRSGVLDQTFNVTVKDKVEKKSVIEGKSVTLDPDTEIQKDDQILWMFGEEDNLIAQISRGTGDTYDGADGRFKDRLKLDKTTGSLTISNISTEHTGRYKLQIISSSREYLYKKFNVSIRLTDELEEKSMNKGESVTLNPHTEIQRDDLVLWMFGYNNNPIAQISGGTGETRDGDKYISKDSLKLDKTTGSLTIRNISSEHVGDYRLKIISSRGILYKQFRVLLQHEVEEKLLNEGESVTLDPDTEIQRDYQILWMFGDEDNLIAQIKGGTEETRDGDKKRFKDKLKLNKTTGSLTISNISTEHTGDYKVQIISSSRVILYNKFKISIKHEVEEKSVIEGESVTLNPHTEIQRDDQIQWMFRDEKNIIAQISEGTGETRDGDQKIFKDSLKLDNTTGSLTITNISTEHTGRYKLQIISSSSGKILYKDFSVSIKLEEKSVDEGDSVTLNPHTEIQRDDLVLWMFRDGNIAQSEGTVEIHDGDKKRFKDRLKLNKTTGSLTITNITDEQAGHYELKIISSSGKILYNKFKISIKPRKKSVMNENTDSTEKQVNESVTVLMPLLGGENPDGVNDEEGTSSL